MAFSSKCCTHHMTIPASRVRIQIIGFQLVLFQGPEWTSSGDPTPYHNCLTYNMNFNGAQKHFWLAQIMFTLYPLHLRPYWLIPFIVFFMVLEDEGKLHNLSMLACA